MNTEEVPEGIRQFEAKHKLTYYKRTSRVAVRSWFQISWIQVYNRGSACIGKTARTIFWKSFDKRRVAAVVWVNDEYIRQGVAWTYLSNPGETPLPVGKSVYMFGCMLFIRIREAANNQSTKAALDFGFCSRCGRNIWRTGKTIDQWRVCWGGGKRRSG